MCLLVVYVWRPNDWSHMNTQMTPYHSLSFPLPYSHCLWNHIRYKILPSSGCLLLPSPLSNSHSSLVMSIGFISMCCVSAQSFDGHAVPEKNMADSLWKEMRGAFAKCFQTWANTHTHTHASTGEWEQIQEKLSCAECKVREVVEWNWGSVNTCVKLRLKP